MNDELALLWMVNMGCIDMNPWYSRIDRPDRPDFVLFDLDPTPEVPYAQTVEVALILKGLLDGIGLASFPKTSGGKGFHVLVPLDRRSTYEDTRALRRARRRCDRGRLPEAGDDRLGEVEAAGRPDRREPERDGEDDRLGLLGAARIPARRSRRRSRGRRSTPTLDPAAFTMGAVLDRVAQDGDLYEGVLTDPAVAVEGATGSLTAGAGEWRPRPCRASR